MGVARDVLPEPVPIAESSGQRDGIEFALGGLLGPPEPPWYVEHSTRAECWQDLPQAGYENACNRNIKFRPGEVNSHQFEARLLAYLDTVDFE